MGQINLSGAIVAGPPTAGSSIFPSTIDTVQLGTTPSPKGFSVATGAITRRVVSPLAFSALQGVGPTDTVTQADFLYFRSDAAVTLRTTRKNPLGGPDIVETHAVQGLFINEYPPNSVLLLLEIQGSATVEYLISGQQ